MGPYDRAISAARRLIAKYGEACVWRKPADQDEDAEPWRDVREGDPDDNNVRIAWFPPGGQLAFLAALGGTEVPAGVELGLMEGGVPFEPLVSDTLLRTGGVKVEITKIDRLAPDGTPVLYTIWIAR